MLHCNKPKGAVSLNPISLPEMNRNTTLNNLVFPYLQSHCSPSAQANRSHLLLPQNNILIFSLQQRTLRCDTVTKVYFWPTVELKLLTSSFCFVKPETK